MTVLFQCKLWLLPALFISQSPAHRVYRDARSRDRERGLSKLSGVDVLYMFISRSDRLLFRLAALRPSEGPQRSALVRQGTPSLSPWPKNIETTARTWHWRVICRACTRLGQACLFKVQLQARACSRDHAPIAPHRGLVIVIDGKLHSSSAAPYQLRLGSRSWLSAFLPMP